MVQAIPVLSEPFELVSSQFSITCREDVKWLGQKKVQDDEIYGCDSIIMALWLPSFYISAIFAMCSMIQIMVLNNYYNN